MALVPISDVIEVKPKDKKLETLKLLFDQGVNKDIKFTDGRTILMRSIIMGDNDIIKFLLENNVDPNIQDNEGLTALFYACRTNNIMCLNLLLNYRANPFLCSKQGETIADFLKNYNF